MQKELLENNNKCLSYSQITTELTKWKQLEELSFLNNVHSQILQQALKNLSQALKEALDKTNPKKFPRFHKKGKQDSFRYPQGFKIDNANGRVYLPKIGWVGYTKSQDIEGIAKNVTVKRSGKHWLILIQVEMEVEPPQHPSESLRGGDLGVKRFLTLSDGSFYEPINIYRKLQKKLAFLQRRLSKKVKCSNNRRKQQQKVNRLHTRIANIRLDYLHKISNILSKNHAVIILEDLQIANMSKSARGSVEKPGKNVKVKSGLNKSILDQGWGEFVRQLDYKLTWKGGLLVLVNPKNTSRCCPECGHTSGENRKTQAVFKCLNCNYTNNADLVGAINVLRAGLARIACGESHTDSLKQEPAKATII